MYSQKFNFDVFRSNHNNWSNLIKEIKPKGIKALNFIDQVNLIVGWSIKNNKKFELPSTRRFAKRLNISKSYVHELEHKFLNKFGFQYDNKKKAWVLNPKLKINKINYKDIKLFIFSTRKFKKAREIFKQFKNSLKIKDNEIDQQYFNLNNNLNINKFQRTEINNDLNIDDKLNKLFEEWEKIEDWEELEEIWEKTD